MALQIGQSKAIRNVVVNAVPRWLVDRAIEKAKAAVMKGLDPNKLQEYADQVLSYFVSKGAKPEQVIAKAGKPKAEWTMLDIAAFKGDKKALENGEVTISELFPATDPKPEVEGPLTGKAIADALPKTGEDPLAARQKELDAQKSGAPSPEEQERIKKREEFDSYALVCAKCPPLTFGTNDSDEMKRHMAEKHPNGSTQKAAAPPPSKDAGGKPKGGLFG